MAISFSCPQCGKKLKAPVHAAGKTSKCPGCGSPVTCPEPIYEAELVEPSPGGGSNPYDDLDDGGAYGVAAEAVPASSAEGRRPCPMCGEMIVATAAKCRFCGEIFDPTLKKAPARGKKARIQSIASFQRGLLILLMVNQKATTILQENGYEVGLLGAKS